MTAPDAAQGRAIAALWMMATTILWTIIAIIIRYLDGRVFYFDLSFLRAMFSALLMMPLVLRHGLANVGPRSKLALWQYALRGLLIFVSQAIYYYAITNMDLAGATVLNTSTAIFATLLGMIWLGERVDLKRWLAMIAGFGGVVLILRPGYAAITLPALAALGSAILFAWSSVLIKTLARSESASRIVFSTNIVMVVLGLGPFLFVGALPQFDDVPLVLAFCALGGMAQYCLSRAMAQADASFVTQFELLRVPLAALGGFMLFSEVPDVWVWIGSAIVFAAIVVLTSGAGSGRREASG